MKKSLREDIVMFSILAGVIGTLAKTITSGIPFLFHITNSAGFIVAGKIIFQTKDLPLDTGHILIALLTHLGIGALIAIGLTYFYFFAGIRFYLIKSLFYAFIVWVFLRNMLVTLAVPGTPEPINLITNVVSLLGHFVYGIVAGYIIVKFNRFTPGFKL